jgi:putative membrane protein
MKPTYLAVPLTAILMLSGAAAQDKGAAQKSTGGADQRFVMEAAQGGMAEVELGQLATQKAASDDVKKFGQRMVDDHTKANDQLKQVASQKNITLPTDIGAKNKATKDHLEKLSGAAFDKAYMTHMVQDHKKDVAEFQKEANSGKDADVKNFASQTLPTLQEHLKMAQETHSKVGGGSANASHKATAAKEGEADRK